MSFPGAEVIGPLERGHDPALRSCPAMSGNQLGSHESSLELRSRDWTEVQMCPSFLWWGRLLPVFFLFWPLQSLLTPFCGRNLAHHTGNQLFASSNLLPQPLLWVPSPDPNYTFTNKDPLGFVGASPLAGLMKKAERGGKGEPSATAPQFLGA